MKFAKNLDDTAVPEWKSKYLDYKGGKKKLKAVAKAIRDVDSKSPDATNKSDFRSPFTSLRDAPVRSLLRRPGQANGASRTSTTPLYHTRSRSEAPSPQWTVQEGGSSAGATPTARPIPINERSPLRGERSPRMTKYGSIIGSPPKDDESTSTKRLTLSHAPTLELPDAALDPDKPKSEQDRELEEDAEYDRPVSPGDGSLDFSRHPTLQAPPTQMQHTGNADEITKPTNHPSAPPSALSDPRYKSLFVPHLPQRTNSTPDGRQRVKRLFSFAGGFPTAASNRRAETQDIALEAYRELDFREVDFFMFLDKELAKIESFYKEKEDEGQERLRTLREQLHTMREQRLEDVIAEEHKQKHLSSIGHNVGKTSRSMAQLGTPSFAGSTAQQDYVRKHKQAVPYHVAKRKLKLALQELYRGLELLKNYSILNRTAFRKIVKKYNKVVASASEGDRPGMHRDYMTDKVNKAHFVQSEVVDSLIHDVEDLYARYFERGNHKMAVGKLRAKTARASDYGGPMFRTGALLSVGLVFGIQGLVYGAIEYYRRGDPYFQTITSYLLQIYGGYFLLLALSGYFVYDAWTFDTWHVNYPFIFELDTRNNLNWRQLSELPSMFCCVLGVVMWLNFTHVGGMVMYIYWPVVLIGVSLIVLFCPAPGVFYSKSRKWFLESSFRLLLAGIYPVEFRDFFLGDMFCSQTYALGNIELYFCLYATHWSNPPVCNSSNSRLLGFFSTLPGIWRALQCIRRYRDTWNRYPHLVNMGKYGFTILQYMTLSLWRLNESSHELKALFITMACINSIYCSIWDIFNDWSLNPISLRNILAYRKHKWWYYFAMVEDPILRFLWLGYVIFPHDYQVQHSSLISFMIAFLEVVRRGIWVIFRVENEHCTNVARYRATKMTELPYPEQIPEQLDSATVPTEVEGQGQQHRPAFSAHTTSSQIEGQTATPSGASSLRRRQGITQDSPVARALRRVGSTVLTAHAQDYERRRPAAVKEGDSDEEDSDGE